MEPEKTTPRITIEKTNGQKGGSKMTNQEYYTVPELAARWRCSADVVYDLLRRGKLQGFKLGSSWRITDEARIQYEQTPVRAAAPTVRRVPVLKIQ